MHNTKRQTQQQAAFGSLHPTFCIQAALFSSLLGYDVHMRVKSIAWGLSVAWVGWACFAGLTAQTTKPPARKPAAPPASALKKEPAEVSCPAPLGVGVKTKTTFCNVIAG